MMLTREEKRLFLEGRRNDAMALVALRLKLRMPPFKDDYDGLWDRRRYDTIKEQLFATTPKTPTFEDNACPNIAERREWQAGRKICAVKDMRIRLGLSLTDAKRALECLGDESIDPIDLMIEAIDD